MNTIMTRPFEYVSEAIRARANAAVRVFAASILLALAVSGIGILLAAGSLDAIALAKSGGPNDQHAIAVHFALELTIDAHPPVEKQLPLVPGSGTEQGVNDGALVLHRDSESRKPSRGGQLTTFGACRRSS